MNRKLWMFGVLSGMLAVSSAKLQAQEVAPPPLPHAGILERGGPGGFAGAPFMDRIELLGFEGMHGGKVVTGAPFSAVAVSETTQTLADGNHITRKIQTNLFRDGQGRFRREMTLPAFGPLAASGQGKSFVMIHDPVANASFILHPDGKTADKIVKPFFGAKGLRGGLKGQRMGRGKMASDANFKTEDLGAQTVAGVNAHGTRYTHTIPAGQIGNEMPITVVSEVWYSDDLQMVVRSTRNDPRFGETTYTLTNLQRQEPDASLFTVPADYTVNTPGRGKRLEGFAIPAPPPTAQ